jgi:hypothetical protein
MAAHMTQLASLLVRSLLVFVLERVRCADVVVEKAIVFLCEGSPFSIVHRVFLVMPVLLNHLYHLSSAMGMRAKQHMMQTTSSVL